MLYAFLLLLLIVAKGQLIWIPYARIISDDLDLFLRLGDRLPFFVDTRPPRLVTTYERLKAEGINPFLPLNHRFTTSLYYRDPDGNEVETTVKPESGKSWRIPEAPSIFAARVLRRLNQNTRNIVFREACGVTPNLYLSVTLSQTNEGTLRTTAYVEVTGMGKAGILFRDSSGEAPFTSGGAAIDRLSVNMLKWFENGWSNQPPCVRADGSLRTQ